MTARPSFNASFGDLLAQVVELKQSLAAPGPGVSPPVVVEHQGRVGADPFSVGGTAGLAADTATLLLSFLGRHS